MKIYIQNEQCPSQVLFAFDEVVEPKVERVRWAVAYTTYKGCHRLVTRLIQRMGVRQWEKSDKTFITSLDFGLTEPSALEYLSSIPSSQVLIANSIIAEQASFFPVNAYHPKVYLFDTARTVGYLVGSANLTNSALLRNTEIVTVGHDVPGNCGWSYVWDELSSGTVPLGQGLLADYKKKWIRPKPRPVDPDTRPSRPSVTATDKPVFWEALIKGALNPMSFDHFWVEAGSMSSGGSHNQLELPRGANRFFGFLFSNYDSDHSVIGYPQLTIGPRVWTDRKKLTWHGKNRMERINLPTVTQGGFDYQNSAILFRRHSSGFEINVVPWKDDAALAWRAASDTLRLVFRLGEKGPRICGMF